MPQKKFQHLRVRNPKVFSSFRVVKPSHVSRKELEAAKKKLGLKRLPKGTKVTVGRFKSTYLGNHARRGKKVKRLAWGIQKLMIPKK